MRLRAATFLSLVLVLSALSATAAADGGVACVCNSDCPTSQICNLDNSTCQPAPTQCTSDGECGCSYFCVGGVCSGNGQGVPDGGFDECPADCGPRCSEYTLEPSTAGGCPRCQHTRSQCLNEVVGDGICRAPNEGGWPSSCFSNGSCGDCGSHGPQCVNGQCCWPDGKSMQFTEESNDSLTYNRVAPVYCCSQTWSWQDGYGVCGASHSTEPAAGCGCAGAGLDAGLLAGLGLLCLRRRR